MLPVNMQVGHGWKCIDPWPIWRWPIQKTDPFDPLTHSTHCLLWIAALHDVRGPSPRWRTLEYTFDSSAPVVPLPPVVWAAASLCFQRVRASVRACVRGEQGWNYQMWSRPGGRVTVAMTRHNSIAFQNKISYCRAHETASFSHHYQYFLSFGIN